MRIRVISSSTTRTSTPTSCSYSTHRLARPPARIAMLPQHGGGCAVAVPPGSVPARQRWPGLSHQRVRALEAHSDVRPCPSQPPTRPPAVPSRLLQCPALPPPPGRDDMRTARQATTGAAIVRTYVVRGVSRGQGPLPLAPARLVRRAMRRHGVIDAYARVAPPCGRGGGERGPLGGYRPPSSPPHCARRSGPGSASGDLTLPPWPTDQCNAMQCNCVRACLLAVRTDRARCTVLAARGGIRTPMTCRR